uniref:endonuclease n=1 Tax=uncultured Polaribacter sp. TaxID=174711 RepID=UPI0026127073|nr:endonuclease [uncultured Polaribacter sp.]
MIKKITLFILLISSVSIFSQQTYYNDVNLNLTGTTLKEELATKIISTHKRFLFYDQIWDASKATDVNPNNNQEVLLIYGWENGTDADATNDRTRGIDNNSGNVGDWNREHVYSQSLGTPPLSDEGPGSDAHHLRPADTQRNSSRNNRKFTAGSGFSGAQSNGGWYPGDEWKGDVARMMMYMYVRYDDRCLISNIGIGDNSNTPDDMIDLFLQWNAEDPVSEIEKQRNDYHENLSNQNAQGNRNPFIDNPRLATRIWGGPEAEDIWGIYTNSDTEAPTVPTNLQASNITTFSIDLSWTASTDNVGVTSYDIYVNGNLEVATSTTSITISNLLPDSNYSFAVLAKDIANNASQLSTPLNTKTLKDEEPPTIPQNLVISNETESTFIISWDASTDNTKVGIYEIYVDDVLYGSSNNEMFTANGLAPSTTYKVQVLAVDEVGNKSALSTPVNGTTTNGSATATELFFSEYLEGSSNNKAVEIVNLTNSDIDLSSYSLKRQSNGGLNGADWEWEMSLAGKTIKSQNVFVIVNEAAGEHTDSKSQKARDAGDFLISIADTIRVHDGDTNFGAPINFNGNDPVGLFKNGILIDIIGTYNGGSANFGKDRTLRRKSGVSSPNVNFDLDNEWEIVRVNGVIDKDNADDFGKHSAIVLSTNNYNTSGVSFYPNPADDYLKIKNTTNQKVSNVQVFTILGKSVFHQKENIKEINTKQLSKGIYILKFEINNKLYSTKFIKK